MADPRHTRAELMTGRAGNGRIGCPGSGATPSRQGPFGDVVIGEIKASGGQVTCPRCGGLYGMRADGRVRAHRVSPSQVIPMIERWDSRREGSA